MAIATVSNADFHYLTRLKAAARDLKFAS